MSVEEESRVQLNAGGFRKGELREQRAKKSSKWICALLTGSGKPNNDDALPKD
jgi:hypothetical protein